MVVGSIPTGPTMENPKQPIGASDMQAPFISLHLLNADVSKPRETRSREILQLAEVASQSWLIKNELGFYAGRYEDVNNILKDRRWHTGVFRLLALKMGLNPELENNRRKVLLALDGDEHTRIKKHISRALRGEGYDEKCKWRALELITEVSDREEIDIVSDLVFRYPSSVISSVLGVPEADWPFIDEITGLLIKHFEGNVGEYSKESSDAGNRFYSYMRKLFNEIRRSGNSDSAIAQMLISQDEMGLDDLELAIIIGSLYGGGVDTVRCQISLIFDYFLSNPGTYKEVSDSYWNDWGKRADSSAVLVGMLEEIMRVNTAVRGSVRYASEDIEYKNIVFPKGTFMFLGYASANMDKSIRENADAVDFGLSEMYYYQDFTFGGGSHRCPGANLAMTEIAVFFQRFIHVFSDIERAGEPIYRSSNASVFGPENLPVKLTKRQEMWR